MTGRIILTRRQFLKCTIGAGGSLLLTFSLSGCQDPTSLVTESAKMVQAKVFRPSVFLSIDPDNTVTIAIPRSEMGQGVRTSLAMILAEELDADWSTIRVRQAEASQAYGPQYTGGSRSVSTFWQPLREAGAVARTMLIAAAAHRWGVDPQACVTGQGAVIHPASDRHLAYGELTEAAARLPQSSPASITLKKPEAFRIVGTSRPSLDGPQFVDGSAIFGLDVKVPGMLYATLARCPVFGGKLAHYETSQAMSVTGVRDVIALENAIAVVAENAWSAMQGQQALSVTWAEGSHPAVSSDSIRQGILAQLSPDVAVDPDDDPVRAGGQLAVLYEMPYLAHATMEPMNCVADVRSDRCEVWAPTQNPQGAKSVAESLTVSRLKRLIHQSLGLPLEVVKVNVTLMGGGFGRRLKVDYVGEAVKVSQAIGAPVQVIWTREDDIRHDHYHPLSCHYASARLEPQADIEWQTFNGPKHIPTGSWRSVGQFTKAFVEECFVDELATALGRDPLDLRLARIREPRLKGVLTLAAEKGDWGSPLPEGWGRGLACFSTWGVTHTAEVVELSVVDSGQVRVHRVVCALDCGLAVNPDNIKAQMEGGIVFALSAALKSKITLENGRTQQTNFHDYPVLRFDEMPTVEVHLVPSHEPPQGVGEMSGPPLTPAVLNAVFAATGKRIRHIPLRPEDLQRV